MLTSFEETERRLLWAALFAGSALSLIVSYRVLTLSFVLGSVEGRWVYEYLQRFPRRAFEVLVVVAAMCASAAALPLSLVRRHEWLAVVTWLLVGLAAQGLLRSQTRYSLERMFVSDGSNGFYSAAQQYPAGVALREFDRVRSTFASIHARGNMPGKLMLVHVLERISRRPAVLAWLVVIVSNLGAVLMYLFARDFFHDKVVGLVAVIFYIFAPGKLFFFPVLNTVTPVPILAFAWLWVRWLQSGKAAYAALLGPTLYALAFYEPTPLATGLLFAGVTALAMWKGNLSPRIVVRHAALAILTFAATYVLMLAFFHFDLIATLRQVGADAVEFNAVHRPYAIWVWRNLLDFAFATGLCQVVLLFAVLGYAIWAGRLTEPAAVLCVGLLSVLLAIDVLGVNRGEVVRLWIFLACLFQLPAAYACARLNSRIAVFLVLGTTLIHDALGTAMLGFATP